LHIPFEGTALGAEGGEVKRFEYSWALWSPNDRTSLSQLNQLGAQGWQVVHVRDDRDCSHAAVLLMREVPAENGEG
jgi:hypothetical protein